MMALSIIANKHDQIQIISNEQKNPCKKYIFLQGMMLLGLAGMVNRQYVTLQK